jgi:hypothetical protein
LGAARLRQPGAAWTIQKEQNESKTESEKTHLAIFESK